MTLPLQEALCFFRLRDVPAAATGNLFWPWLSAAVEARVFTIGEFSKVTGLTVKTLRFYHEEGLLEPTCVYEQSGYRYYDSSKIEAARVISFLRSLEFPVAEIRELLGGNEAELTAALERQRKLIDSRIGKLRKV